MTYQLQRDTYLGPSKVIKKLIDATFIPFDLANSDYQTYIKWLDGYESINGEWIQTSPEGNTPLPADADEDQG